MFILLGIITEAKASFSQAVKFEAKTSGSMVPK